MKTIFEAWRIPATLAVAVALCAGCAATPGMDEVGTPGDNAAGDFKSPASERVVAGIAELVLTNQAWPTFEQARENPVSVLNDGSPLFAYIRATRPLGELAHPADAGGTYAFSDYPHLFLQVGDTDSLRILGTCYLTLTGEETQLRELVVPLAPLTYRPGQIPADCWLASVVAGGSGKRSYELRLAGFAGKFESWLPVADLLAVAPVLTDLSNGAADYATMLRATPLGNATLLASTTPVGNVRPGSVLGPATPVGPGAGSGTGTTAAGQAPIPVAPEPSAPIADLAVSPAGASEAPAPAAPAPEPEPPAQVQAPRPAPVAPEASIPAVVAPVATTPAQDIAAASSPEPVVQARAIPAPVMPALVMPAPVMPAPSSTAPVIPAVSSPAPEVPAAQSPAPIVTAVPSAQSPVPFIYAPRPAPITAAEPRPAPVTPQPAPFTYAERSPAPVAPQPAPFTYAERSPAPVAPRPAPFTYTERSPVPVTPRPAPFTYTEPSPAPVVSAVPRSAPIVVTSPSAPPATPGPVDSARGDPAPAAPASIGPMAAVNPTALSPAGAAGTGAFTAPARNPSLVAINNAPLPGPRQDIGSSRMELQLQTLSTLLLGRPPSEAYFMDRQWTSTTDQRGRVVQQHAYAAAVFKGASCSWQRLRAFRRPGAPGLLDVAPAGDPIEIDCTELR